MQFYCPNCGKMLSAPDELGGKKAKCKACGEVIGVPEAPAGEERPIELEPIPPSVETKEPVVEVPQAAVAPRTSGMAIASLVLGIVGWFFLGITSILAIIFGFVARSQIRKSAGRLKGGGFAVAGITLGFTWLAIIMIIMPAMLLPALVRAREQARKAVCKSNLKQIGIAFAIYANDYEHLPGTLEQLIPDYLSTEHVLHCPSDKKKEGISYIYRDEVRGKKLDEIKSPGRYPLLYDKSGNHKGGRNVIYADGHREWVWERDFH